MSLTTSQIDVQFRRLYKEQSQRYFDSNWEITAINDSIEDIWDEILNVNPEYAPALLFQHGYISGQREYTLPAAFESGIKTEVTDIGGPPFPVLQKISFRDVGTITALPFNIAWTTVGQGEPAAYYMRFVESGQTPIGASSALTSDAWVIGYDPIPGRGGSNNVNVWYNATSVQVTGIDSELPDLPVDFHDLIPRRMCVLAAALEETPRLEFYRGMYNDSLLRKLNRVVRGPQGMAEVIELDWED